jgi:hypothetical protein
MALVNGIGGFRERCRGLEDAHYRYFSLLSCDRTSELHSLWGLRMKQDVGFGWWKRYYVTFLDSWQSIAVNCFDVVPPVRRYERLGNGSIPFDNRSLLLLSQSLLLANKALYCESDILFGNLLFYLGLLFNFK